MLKILGKIPKQVAVAVSGGSDSMAAADFISRGNHEVTLVFFDHGTPACAEGRAVVERFATQRGLNLVTSGISREKDPKESPQEYWRNERYAFLRQLNMPVVVAHTLDDVLETWIFSATHGTPSLMQYQAGNIIRPFLYCEKSELREWCERKGVEWAEDASNQDVAYPRNRIRHNVMPELMAINPGLKKVMRKKLLKRSAL